MRYKRDLAQIRRDANAFFGKKGLECLEATVHYLYKNITDFDVCIEFEILKVKVPVNFLGTADLSLPSEGRNLC